MIKTITQVAKNIASERVANGHSEVITDLEVFTSLWGEAYIAFRLEDGFSGQVKIPEGDAPQLIELMKREAEIFMLSYEESGFKDLLVGLLQGQIELAANGKLDDPVVVDDDNSDETVEDGEEVVSDEQE